MYRLVPSEQRDIRAEKYLGLVLIAFGLAACSAPPPSTFDLDSAPGISGIHRPRKQLVIDSPTASTLLASQRIVIRTADDQVAYLKGSQWAAELPDLVQTKLLASFENTHLIKNVGSMGLAADRHLQTEIRSFDANVSDRQAHVAFAVRLIDAQGRIVAGEVFSAKVPIQNDDNASLALALNQALVQVLRNIVLWTAPRI